MQTPTPLSFRLEDGKKHYQFDTEELRRYLAETTETSLGVEDEHGNLVSALPVATLRRLITE